MLIKFKNPIGNTCMVLLVVLFSMSCENNGSEEKGDAVTAVAKETNLAQEIIDKAIGFSGLAALDTSTVQFTFRDIVYRYQRDYGLFEYQRIQLDSSGVETKDVLNNDSMTRSIDQVQVSLTDEWKQKYSNSINSVMYFAFLPYKLNDDRVLKEYLNQIAIKGTDYHKIKVSFEPREGADHKDDVFIYYFDVKDYSMDYFAYEYFTDEGGFRFREAFNSRKNKGLTIQDYHNYKPIDTVGVHLERLDELFGSGELKLLSEILTEEVSVK
ncbi:MAG: hypothetical protein HRT71_00070 [Flavobacteriales bacterium]|nr:hypothetical protein [Flavobacteriales bacterium]